MKNQNDAKTVEEKEYYALLKRVFDVLAPFYDIISLPILRVRKQVVDFTDVPRGFKILDIATGTGDQALAFAREGYDVTGVDISEAMLNRAKKKNKYANAKFEVADVTKLPFNDTSFDVSCVSFALHDMPLTIREKTLKEMIRVTKNEGKIVIVDYALPRNRVGRFLVYHLIKLYEGKYYVNFIHSDNIGLLNKVGIETKAVKRVVFGAGIILTGARVNKGP